MNGLQYDIRGLARMTPDVTQKQETSGAFASVFS